MLTRCVPLEKAAEAVCEANSKPPFIYQLPPDQGREALERAQETPVRLCPAQINRAVVDTGAWGTIPVYCARPQNPRGDERALFYIHGAGWVFGSFHTHEKLVRELAARTGSAVIFPEYSRSPEARYPTAIEQCYGVLQSLPRLREELGWGMDLSRLAVAGDSVGGNMATVMTLLAKFRGGPQIEKQLLYYPVTNACLYTPSYREFAWGYYLYRAGMAWFWDQYAPSAAQRREITASPLLASLQELRGLPRAMVLCGEADVLRDEGEAYARRLREAGVEVTALRFQAVIHDFVMLNALDQTRACRAAMDASVAWLCGD